MKKILSLCLCLSMVFSFFCFTYVEAIEEETTLIEKNSDCHELADNWFDNQKYDSQKYDFYNVLEYYFNFRQSDFKSENNDNSQIDINVSQSVYEDIKKRTKLVKNMQTSMNIAFLDADVKFAINDVNISNDNIILQVKEWTFYDYDNLVDEKVSRDTSGFGTDHIMTLCNNGDGYKIETDTYTESDMTGMIASSYKEPDYNGLEVETKNDFDDVISLCGYSYSANAAVSYADTYWENYNPNYSNYNSIGGDCANFVSQCLSAGGLQFDDNWYWYSYSNRSSSWAYCPSQRSYFSSLGNLIDNPSNSQVQKGNPVWYYKNGAWAHAAICVGTDSAGTPIVDAHNNNRYHVTWTLGGSSYWSGYSTVQLQDSTQSSGLGTPVDVGSDFYAEIMNKKSWLFLQNDNLNVNIQHRTGYPEQVWHFERQGDGSYKITSALDGKCLDVTSGSSASGANVGVYEDNGSDAQRWYIYGELDHYQLKAKCGNCVLDVKNGNFSIGENIQMWEYNGSDAQKFQIDKVAEPPVNLGDNFNALIINKKSWLHLENDNTNVIIRKGTGYLQQVWHFERQVDGGYKIISTLDGKCLDVNNMLPDAGTNVKVYEDNGTSAQRWYIYGPLDHYQLKAGCGNCVLDIENGNLSVGANVQMWDFNDTDAQKFHIWKVDKIAEDIGDNFVASIRSTESGLPLTVNDSNQVVLASSESSSKQLWKFSRLENGSYTIQSAYDGKLFSVESDEDSDKDLRILALNNVGGNNQYWKFYKNDQGYFLKPTSSSRFLGINDANFTEGNYLQIYNKSENDLNLKAQKFSVYKSDDVQLFAPTLKVAADGSNAKFTWNDVNGETGYNLTIYDSSSKANVKNNVSSGTSYSLSAGKYTAKVEAYNYFETKQSNTVEFEIKSGEIPTPLPTLKPTTPPQYSSTVTVGSVSCIPGGEVTVPVRIKNNPGISSFTFKLNYDKSKLTPVSITKMGGMPGSLTSNIQQSGIDLTKLDYVTAVWSNETDYSESGEMFSVKFKVSESVPTGEDIPIQISYTKGNIIDRNYNDVDVNLVDGAVNTAQVKYGDIYKDGEINNKDLVRLRQYLAEWNIQLTEDEYKAADVFRDGTVNNKDLVRLSQYLAEWDVRLGE